MAEGRAQKGFLEIETQGFLEETAGRPQERQRNCSQVPFAALSSAKTGV